MYVVYFSASFVRSLKKLVQNNPQLNTKIRRKIELLSKNPKYPSLRLHKLSGQNNWSMTVAEDLRIVFTIDKDQILVNDIGSHDDVY